jgi:hypothetical protein
VSDSPDYRKRLIPRRRQPNATARAQASSVSASVDPPPPPPLPPGFGPPGVGALLAGVTVTCAEPERVGSATDTAVTVTVAGDGSIEGAE